MPEFLTVPPLLATGLLAPVDEAVVVLLAFSVLPVTLMAVLLSLALAAPPVLLLASEPVGVIVVVFPLTFVEVPPLVAADPVPVTLVLVALPPFVAAAPVPLLVAVGVEVFVEVSVLFEAIVLPEFLTVPPLFAAWLLAPLAVVVVVFVGEIVVVLPLTLVEVPPVVATAPVPVLFAELFLVLSEPRCNVLPSA